MPLRVLNKTMNIIQSIILDIAGGSMNTALLTFLVWFVYTILFAAFGSLMVYLMALIKWDSVKPTEPVVIKDAQ